MIQISSIDRNSNTMLFKYILESQTNGRVMNISTWKTFS